MPQVTRLPARSVKEGMYLDLEDDSYATIPCSEECDDCDSTISSFEFEYQFVESVEFQNINTVVINCASVSFGCPPNHKVRVVDLDEEEQHAG